MQISVDLEWDPRICISDAFPGDVAVGGLGPHFENHCHRGFWMPCWEKSPKVFLTRNVHCNQHFWMFY